MELIILMGSFYFEKEKMIMIIVKWFKNKIFEIEMKHALYSAIK